MATRRVVRETGLRYARFQERGSTRRHGPARDYESAALTAELPAPNPMLEPNRAVPGGQRSAKTSPRRAPVVASMRPAAASRSSESLSRNVRSSDPRVCEPVRLVRGAVHQAAARQRDLEAEAARGARIRGRLVVLEEGLPGTITYAHFKAPGRRHNGKVVGECLGLGVSEQRLALYCRSGRVKLIDQPFTEPRT